MKSVKKRYRPSSVEKDDKLKVPSMDDSIHRRLMAIKKSKAVKGNIDAHDSVLYKIQKSIVYSSKPLLFLLSQDLGDSWCSDAWIGKINKNQLHFQKEQLPHPKVYKYDCNV